MSEILLLVSAMALVACGGGRRGGSDAADSGGGADTGAPACGTPGASLDGLPCTCDSDCVEGAACRSEVASGYAGGECTRICDSGEVCSEGASCWSSTCAQECTSSADCGRSRICGPNGYCVGMCTRDADCDSGHCNPYNGYCTDGGEPSGGGIMVACTDHSECKSELCYEGFCISRCSVSMPGCPDGAICFGDGSPGDLGFCGSSCETHDDCSEPGLACADVPAPAGAAVCVPESWTS